MTLRTRYEAQVHEVATDRIPPFFGLETIAMSLRRGNPMSFMKAESRLALTSSKQRRIQL